MRCRIGWMLPLVATVVACGNGTGTPESHEGALTGGTSDTEATELRGRYFESVCRLYTEPTCVTAQKGSCSAHVGFESRTECVSFLEKTTAHCEGWVKQLPSLKADIQACIDQVDAWDCEGSDALCDASDDKIDARGACAPIAASIESACNTKDTGI